MPRDIAKNIEIVLFSPISHLLILKFGILKKKSCPALQVFTCCLCVRLQGQRETSEACLVVTFPPCRRWVVRHLFALVSPRAERPNLPLNVCMFKMLGFRAWRGGVGEILTFINTPAGLSSLQRPPPHPNRHSHAGQLQMTDTLAWGWSRLLYILYPVSGDTHILCSHTLSFILI